MDMKRNINFKNVLCMAAITLVTGMLGGCEDNSIATPVGKLPNETALDNNFGILLPNGEAGGTGHPNHNENRPRLSRQIQ